MRDTCVSERATVRFAAWEPVVFGENSPALGAEARERRADKVRMEVLARILDGRWSSGARIVELALAREMDVSQGTVREALGKLEAMNLVATTVYSGTRVRSVTYKELIDALHVRATLEEIALLSAFQQLRSRMPVLLNLATTIQRAVEVGNRAAFAQADIEFHRQIVAASGNVALVRAWESLAFEMSIACRTLHSKRSLQRVQEMHWTFLDALLKQHTKEALRSLRQHNRLLGRPRKRIAAPRLISEVKE